MASPMISDIFAKEKSKRSVVSSDQKQSMRKFMTPSHDLSMMQTPNTSGTAPSSYNQSKTMIPHRRSSAIQLPKLSTSQLGGSPGDNRRYRSPKTPKNTQFGMIA